MEGKLRLLWEYVGLEMPERYRCKIKNQAESASLALRSRIRGNILEFRTQAITQGKRTERTWRADANEEEHKAELSEPRTLQ